MLENIGFPNKTNTVRAGVKDQVIEFDLLMIVMFISIVSVMSILRNVISNLVKLDNIYCVLLTNF